MLPLLINITYNACVQYYTMRQSAQFHQDSMSQQQNLHNDSMSQQAKFHSETLAQQQQFHNATTEQSARFHDEQMTLSKTQMVISACGPLIGPVVAGAVWCTYATVDYSKRVWGWITG